MGRYIMPELVVERIDLEDEAIAEMQDGLPGWEPVEAAVDTQTIRVSAGMASDVATSLSRVPDTIFKYSGRSLHRIYPVAATAATGVVTITAVDAAGYTIPEGTQIAGTNPDGDLIGFTLDNDAVIPAASTSVAGVAVTAAETGEGGNDVVGFGQALDTLNYLQSIEFTTATSGGVDEEDDETYLNRLREELQLMAPRPILPRDFATFARRIPGVYRAVVIDGLDPVANTTGNERTVAVSAVDEAGDAVDAATRNAIEADLEGRREWNFNVFVFNPTYTTINVDFDVTAWPGYDAASVEADIVSALGDYLSPAVWGTPPNDDTRSWINRTTVPIGEIEGVIYRVDGVRTVDSLELNGGTSSISMTGHATLPTVGTVTGTVTETTN